MVNSGILTDWALKFGASLELGAWRLVLVPADSPLASNESGSLADVPARFRAPSNSVPARGPVGAVPAHTNLPGRDAPAPRWGKPPKLSPIARLRQWKNSTA